MPRTVEGARRALAAWLLGLAAAASAQAPALATARLEPGPQVEIPLAGGEAVDLSLDLQAGQYLEVWIETRDVEPLAVLAAPDGRELVRQQGTNTRIGDQACLVLGLVAGAGGTHLLRLSSPELAGQPGRLLVRIAKRPAVPADAWRLEALDHMREATRLGLEATPAPRQVAVEEDQRALELWVRAADLPGQGATLSDLANLKYALNDLAGAVEAASSAAERWKAAGRPREEGRERTELATFHFARHDQAATAAELERALALNRAAGDVFGEAGTLNHQGWLRNAQGDKRGALALYQQALPLRRLSASREGESVTLNDIGRVQVDLGNAEEAIAAFQAALRLRTPERNPQGAGIILGRLGTAYRHAGAYQAALDAYQQSVALARRAGDDRALSAALHNLAFLHGALGDRQRERDLLGEVLALCRARDFRPCQASALTSLAQSWLGAGDPAAALGQLDQALEIRRALRDTVGEADALNIRAEAQLGTGALDEAQTSISRSLELFRSLGGLRLETFALTTQGAVQLARGEDGAARETLEEALRRFRAQRDAEGEGRVLQLLGRLAARQGDLEGARDRMREGLDLVEPIRGGLAEVELRSTYLASLQGRYEELIDVLMALDRARPGQGHAAEALQICERARARGLLDLLAESSVGLRDDAAPELVARAGALRHQLAAKAAARSRLLAGKHRDEEAAAVEREVADLAERWRAATADLRRASPGYAALTQPEALPAARIQALLDPDTVLLEVASGERHGWLWAVTPTSLSAHELPARRELDAAARELVERLTDRARRHDGRAGAGAEAAVRRAAAALGRLIFSPVAGELAGAWRGRRLAIVASGALEVVPFAALEAPPPPGAARAPRPLLADHEVVRLPSASVIQELRRETAGRPPAPRAVAVLADPVFDRGDPRVAAASPGGLPETAVASLPASARRAGLGRLPFSHDEAEAIAAAAGRGRVLVALGFDASRETATGAALREYRIVHFATHGILDTEQPELSGVVLSLVDRRGRPRDGYLRLTDVYGLRLSADLVVLSGCQTALGKEIRGEGLVGLTRGFMYAGAPRVIASLWEVDDLATAELMRRFYKAMLGDGLRPAAALRAAQLGLRRQKRWSSPFYWAPFVLQGEWR